MRVGCNAGSPRSRPRPKPTTVKKQLPSPSTLPTEVPPGTARCGLATAGFLAGGSPSLSFSGFAFASGLSAPRASRSGCGKTKPPFSWMGRVMRTTSPRTAVTHKTKWRGPWRCTCGTLPPASAKSAPPRGPGPGRRTSSSVYSSAQSSGCGWLWSRCLPGASWPPAACRGRCRTEASAPVPGPPPEARPPKAPAIPPHTSRRHSMKTPLMPETVSVSASLVTGTRMSPTTPRTPALDKGLTARLDRLPAPLLDRRPRC